tara:strand:+ start:5135 stop:5278 length:144 start_codon:yes stop_codon:yes gene_type:complete
MDIQFEIINISQQQIKQFEKLYSQEKKEIKKNIIKILREKYNITINE